MRILVAVGTLAVLAGCSNGPPPTTPSVQSAPEIAYSGTIIDSVQGTGSLTVTVSSGDASTGGIWIETYPGKKADTRFISGSVNGGTYSATVSDCLETDTQACFPNCRQTFTGTLTSNTLAGSYAEVAGDSCAMVRSGSVNAVKQ